MGTIQILIVNQPLAEQIEADYTSGRFDASIIRKELGRSLRVLHVVFWASRKDSLVQPFDVSGSAPMRMSAAYARRPCAGQ
jgi:hypothetical protein